MKKCNNCHQKAERLNAEGRCEDCHDAFSPRVPFEYVYDHAEEKKKQIKVVM